MAAETSQTLDRGLRVLEVVAESPDGLTVTELAAVLGIGRTVVYRLVVTLEQHAFLRRAADGKCRLGLGVLAMGRQVQPIVRDTAMPALRLLADAVNATAVLTVVDGQEALAAVVVEPSRSDLHVASRAGARHPLEHGAAGRRISCDFDPHFRHNAESAFAADEQSGQIEFIASPTGTTELNQLTV